MSEYTTTLDELTSPFESNVIGNVDIDIPTDVFTDTQVQFGSQSLSDSGCSQIRKILAEACEKQFPAEEEFYEHFMILLSESIFEFGFETPAERYVRVSLDRYGAFARDWLTRIFHRHYNKPSELCKILRTIAHFDYEKVSSQGAIMATAALFHVDAEVRECGVRCFENWEERSCLRILQNCRFPEDWLSEYVRRVIADLEGL